MVGAPGGSSDRSSGSGLGPMLIGVSPRPQPSQPAMLHLSPPQIKKIQFLAQFCGQQKLEPNSTCLSYGIAQDVQPPSSWAQRLVATIAIGAFGGLSVIPVGGAELIAAGTAAHIGIDTGDVAVYTATDSAGEINYIGITNNIERRAAEQMGSKGIRIRGIPGLANLSRSDARSVEQVLIEHNGGPGGQLLNKINSISPNNPLYGSSIRRGCAILSAVGYPALGVC